MLEQFPHDRAIRRRDYARQYEYLIVTVGPTERLADARQRLSEHAEYGKWELERTRIYVGGTHRYWLRRRVLKVERSL